MTVLRKKMIQMSHVEHAKIMHENKQKLFAAIMMKMTFIVTFTNDRADALPF